MLPQEHLIFLVDSCETSPPVCLSDFSEPQYISYSLLLVLPVLVLKINPDTLLLIFLKIIFNIDIISNQIIKIISPLFTVWNR